jgi:hypothetical protein
MLDESDISASPSFSAGTNVIAFPLGSAAACVEPLSVVLGRRLRWLRVERGWSRKHVATRLRIPVNHVEGHERGTRQIKARELAAYARLFRARISDFFKDPPTQGSA